MTLTGLSYLGVTLLWYWVAALVFGAGVGLLTPGRGRPFGFVPWIVMLAVGIAISVSHLVTGRAGLWYDMVVLMVAAYFVGCCLGGLTRDALGVGERVVESPVPALAGNAPAAPAAALEVVAPYQWQALKEGSALTLTGFVPSPAIRTRIMAAAKALLPKLGVIDRLQPAAGAPEGLETLAGAAFGHLARLDQGKASLVDRAYTLSGTAPSETARAAVLKMLKSLPAGFTLDRSDIPLKGEVAAEATVPPIPSASPLGAPGPAEPVGEVSAEAAAAAPPPATDKPEGLPAPREGKADDLKRIRGIGPQNERRLNDLGIWHFDQIAAWSAREVAWVGHFLAFPGRIEREKWVVQAKALAAPVEAAKPAEAAPEVPLTVPGETPAVAPAAPEATSAATTPTSFRPANALDAARNGKPDRLIFITGIEPETEARLNTLGIYHFDQLAQLGKADLAELSVALGTPGKAIEDNWKGEAAMLAIGSETDRSKAMKAKAASLGDVVPAKG